MRTKPTPAPSAETIAAALKSAYPFMAVNTGSEERAFVAKAKRACAPLGIAPDMIDHAINATRSYGQIVVWASPRSILAGLFSCGYLVRPAAGFSWLRL